MTSTAPERVAIVGTGLIGTSIAMASARVGCDGLGLGRRRRPRSVAAERAGLRDARSLEDAVDGADIVVVCAPVPSIPELVARGPRGRPRPIVTDAGSIKGPSFARSSPSPAPAPRGSSAATPWAARSAPVPSTRPRRSSTASSGCSRPKGEPGRRRSRPRGVDRTDRRTSDAHVAGTTRSTGGVREPSPADRLDRADGSGSDRGGRRARHPAAGRGRIPRSHASRRRRTRRSGARSCCRTARRSPRRSTCTRAASADLRAMVVEVAGEDVEETFDDAKQARLRLAAKPQVRAGVAVLQVAGARPARRPGRAHVGARGAFREHRGPPDRPLARGWEGDRAPHRRADVGRRRAPRAGVAVVRPDPTGLRASGARPCDARRHPAGEVTRARRQVDRAPLVDPGCDGSRSQPSSRASGFPRRSLDGCVPCPRLANGVDLHSKLGLGTVRRPPRVTVPRGTTMIGERATIDT